MCRRNTLIEEGREFQTVGPAIKNDKRLNVLSLWCSTQWHSQEFATGCV